MAEHHSRTYCSGSHVYGQIAIIQSSVGIVLLNSVTLLNGLTRRNDCYRMVDLLSPKWVMEETLMSDPHCSYTSRSRSAGTPKSPKNLGDLEMRQLPRKQNPFKSRGFQAGGIWVEDLEV